MKKIICVLCFIALLLSLCACRSNKNDYLISSDTQINESSEITEISETASSETANEAVSSADTSSESESSEDKSSKVQSTASKKSESVAESSKESNIVSSKIESTVESSAPVQSATQSSEPAPETIQSAVQTPVENQPQQTDAVATVSKFTVNDPENTRGLSTSRIGFSYGVASGGVPHNQSVLNQNTFDGFAGVNALALDNKTAEKVMYLTFDNGYEYENLTANILDTLNAKGVKAAFFVTLGYVKENHDLVQRMINEGHIVGNHSATHPSFPELTRTQMAEDIAKLDEYLIDNFAYTSPYFRFPSGEYSESALELVTSIGYKSVFWSAAYADWDTKTQKGEEYAYSTVTSRFHSGAVILLHAVSRDNAQALGRIIDTAIAQGYTFKTLDDYFNR